MLCQDLGGYTKFLPFVAEKVSRALGLDRRCLAYVDFLLMAPRLTQQSLKILKAFLSDTSKAQTGADLMRVTGLPSGTVYPILFRFERAGLLTSEWADEEAQFAKPRRRLYRISAEGAAVARTALAELTSPYDLGRVSNWSES